MATIIAGTGTKFTFDAPIFMNRDLDGPQDFFTEADRVNYELTVNQIDVPASFRTGIQTRVPGEINWQATVEGKLTDCGWLDSMDGTITECTNDASTFDGTILKGTATVTFNSDHLLAFAGVLTELRISAQGRNPARFSATVRNASTSMTRTWAAP